MAGYCGVEGCEKPAYAKQKCKPHYMAKWHTGGKRGRPASINRVDYIWEQIVNELGITGSSGRKKQI